MSPSACRLRPPPAPPLAGSVHFQLSCSSAPAASCSPLAVSGRSSGSHGTPCRRLLLMTGRQSSCGSNRRMTWACRGRTGGRRGLRAACAEVSAGAASKRARRAGRRDSSSKRAGGQCDEQAGAAALASEQTANATSRRARRRCELAEHPSTRARRRAAEQASAAASAPRGANAS